jgi:hypothetical protein
MILHCMRAAAEGGVNRLLDHEIAYIALRDHDPARPRLLYRARFLDRVDTGVAQRWRIG